MSYVFDEYLGSASTDTLLEAVEADWEEARDWWRYQLRSGKEGDADMEKLLEEMRQCGGEFFQKADRARASSETPVTERRVE